MTGVVLRCPNCGTTRAATGECEACHEAEVRYYCTNHSPGLWLESRGCAQCGARFGDPAPPPAAVPRPARPTSARGPGAPVPRPAPAPLPPRAAPPPGPFTRRGGGPPPVEEDGWGRAGAPLPADEEPADATFDTSDPGSTSRRGPRGGPRRDPRAEMLARWQEMMRAASRGRSSRRPSPPELDVAPVARGVGGCLMRLVFLVMLFIFAMVLFSGAFFQIGY